MPDEASYYVLARNGNLYGGELVTEVAGLWVYGYVAKVSSARGEAWVTYPYGEVEGEGCYPLSMKYESWDLLICDPDQVFAS